MIIKTLKEQAKFILANKHAFLIHFIYWAIVFVIVSADILNKIFPFRNDYVQYYAAGRLVLSGRIVELYEYYFSSTDMKYYQVIQLEYTTTYFRYLPTAAVFFSAFSIGDAFQSWSCYMAVVLACAIVSANLVVKISGMQGRKNAKLAVFFFLASTIIPDTYGSGQVTSIISCLLLSSLYLFLKHRDMAASIILGSTFAIKPSTYIVILFVLLTSKSASEFIKRSLAMALPILPNVIIFLLYPRVLSNFIFTNAVMADDGVTLSMSISTTAFIASFFGNKIIIMITIMAILSILYIKIKGKFISKIESAFTLGLLATVISQTDIWTNNLIMLLPFLFLVETSTRNALMQFLLLFVVQACIGLSLVFATPAFSIFPAIFFPYLFKRVVTFFQDGDVVDESGHLSIVE